MDVKDGWVYDETQGDVVSDALGRALKRRLTPDQPQGGSMRRALLGVLIFTAVEVVTLVLWLVLAGVPFGGNVLAVLVLAVGLFGEHYVAVNVGAGRPPFGPLP